MSETMTRETASNSVRGRSSAERQNILVSKLAKLDQKIEETEAETVTDAARTYAAKTDNDVNDVNALVDVGITSANALANRKTRMESAIRALDIEPTDADVKFVHANKAKVLRLLRMSRGLDRTKALLALRKLAETPTTK